MKQLFIFVGAVCLIAMLLPACAPAPEPEPAPEPVFDQAAEEAAIRELNRQIYSAVNNHDAKAFTALYVEDYENWTGSRKGRADWEQYYTERWSRGEDSQYEMVEEIGIVFVTSNVTIYKYRGKSSGRLDEEGKEIPSQVRLWADVYVKKNDKWLCAADFDRVIEE